MDDFFFKAFDLIMTHGQYSITVLLFIIIMYLYKANISLQKKLDKKDEKLFKIYEDYKNGTISTTQALGEIKNVLVEIRIKL